MKFSRNAPAVLIGAVVIVVTIVSLVSSLIARQMTASFEETEFALMGRIMDSTLRSAENKATAGAEMLAALPNVRKAFAARNRDELLAITKAAYAIQHEKYGISQAQFHLPTVVSFLRVHNPSKHGEDLSSYRSIVVEVNSSNAIRKGVEVTTSGVGIFGTVPMADEAGKHNGSVEMALEFGPVLDDLKKAYGFELALFIDEKILRETATSLGGDIFNDKNRVGKYIKFHSTHPELLRGLVQDADIGITENAHYLRDSGGLPYGVLLQPVYDYAKKQIGVVAIAQNYSATHSAGNRAVVWQVLLGVTSVVLLIGVIAMVIRGMLLQPLAVVNTRMAALAKGEPAEEIENADAYCDEVRDLAESYEQLRAGQKGASGDSGSAS